MQEFDFLENEHDSISESAESGFGWLSTMRPRSLSETARDDEAEGEAEGEGEGDNDEDTSDAADRTSSGQPEETTMSDSETPCQSDEEEAREEIREEEDKSKDEATSVSTQGELRASVELLASQTSSRTSHAGSMSSLRTVPPLALECSHHWTGTVEAAWQSAVGDLVDDGGDLTSQAVLQATLLFRVSVGHVAAASVTTCRSLNLSSLLR